MKCKKCNEQLSLFDKYCTNCGEKVTRFWENIKIKPIKMPKIKLPQFKITKEICLIIIALKVLNTAKDTTARYVSCMNP